MSGKRMIKHRIAGVPHVWAKPVGRLAENLKFMK
jgi:hypothetical protein